MSGTNLLRSSRWYFTCLSIVLFAALMLLIINGRSAGFIDADAYHPFLLNVFFINLTFVGDAIFAVCLLALILFYFRKKGTGLALLYSVLISGVAVQVIKNFVEAPSSPKLFFEAGQYLHFINGVDFTVVTGFPSGHTAIAFAIATVFVMMTKEKKWQLLVLIIAVLVGYSRMYLAQHFLMDVVIGAIIGSSAGFFSVYIASNSKVIKSSIKNLHNLNSDQSSPGSFVQPV